MTTPRAGTPAVGSTTDVFAAAFEAGFGVRVGQQLHVGVVEVAPGRAFPGQFPGVLVARFGDQFD